MKKYLTIILFCLVCFCRESSAQTSVVQVNKITGTANVVIPVYTVAHGAVQFPINLVYNNNGVKPTDVEGNVAIGWTLQAGGQVSRLLRGSPDDYQTNDAGAPRLGWMYNTNQSKIAGFNIANVGSPNCTNETADFNYINSNFSYQSDTEPDIFYVSAPGLSCQLVYNQAIGKFQPLDYQDLVISYSTAANNSINSFTIINDQGTRYVFSTPESVYKYVTAAGTVNYFANTFNQLNSTFTYNDAWFLSSITDVNGNWINLGYATGPSRTGTDPVKLYIPGDAKETVQYSVSTMVSPKLLASVRFSGEFDDITTQRLLQFNWALSDARGTGQNSIYSITGLGHNFNFYCSPVAFQKSDNTTYYRSFLREFTDVGCNTPVDYRFSYAGETATGTPASYTTLLPDSTSTQLDYWGYYSANANTGKLLPALYAGPSAVGGHPYEIKTAATNAGYSYSLSGANRTVDPSRIAYGSLTQVKYMQGGATTITYEPNDYYDVPAAGVVQGAGVRVKQVSDDDGTGTSTIVRNYSYLNPSTGLTSGKPLSLPQFAFTIPYNGTVTGAALWTNATVLSAYDLSSEDHTVMYEYVKESKVGGGSSLYQYYLPATNWDSSAVPACTGCSTADWSPTMNYVARSTCASYGPISSSINGYPFAANTNYDLERGLPKKVTAFKDNGNEVSEVNYTYQRTAPPTAISAFRFEPNSNNGALPVKAYAKYTVYANASELKITEQQKLFDSNNQSQARTTTINYTYGNTYHKLQTQQITNSDAGISTTTYSYIKDYTAAAGTNTNVTALYQMQQLNINAPVESYTSIKRGAAAPLITQASLVLYQPFGTRYLPSKTLNLVQPTGSSFVPLSVNGQTLTYDPQYFATGNFTEYDSWGGVRSWDDANRHRSAQLFDETTLKAKAAIKNAAASEVWFDDFDSEFNSSFNWSPSTGSSSRVADRNLLQALNVSTGNASGFSIGSGSITKNAQASRYVFSVWVNAATSGNLTLTMTPVTGSPVTQTLPFTVTTGWKYLETKVPVSSMTSTFSIKVTTSTGVAMDDILFYPENAEVTTSAYDPATLNALSQTNTNGVATYFQNDQWGRNLYTFDQDRNIVKKTNYLTPAILQNPSSGVLHFSAGSSGTIDTTTPVYLYTDQPSPCLTIGMTYIWDFGDGTAPITTGTYQSPAHTYTVAGTYTAHLTVNSTVFPTTSSSASISVAAYNSPNTNLKITFTGIANTYNSIASISFYQGATMVYSFSSAQLPNAVVAKGVYTLKITPVASFGSAYILGDHTNAQCTAGQSGTYIFNVDLSNCNNFTISLASDNECI